MVTRKKLCEKIADFFRAIERGSELKFYQDFFVQKGPALSKKFLWSEVEEVRALLADRVTYDEQVLVIVFENGDSVCVGELDRSFSSLLMELEARFRFAHTDWREQLEVTHSGPIVLFKR